MNAYGQEIPSPPQNISSDGREIWDWAAKLGAQTHRIHESRQLRQRIAVIGTVCGDCSKWMKRGDCPREKGVMVGGPTMSTPKCREFVEETRSTRLRDELQAALAKVGVA